MDPNADLPTPEVLAAFRAAYGPPIYRNGVCDRCGVKPSDTKTHSEWHRVTAQREWVQAAAIVNGVAIADLDVAAPLTGGELVAVVQNNRTVRATTKAIGKAS